MLQSLIYTNDLEGTNGGKL